MEWRLFAFVGFILLLFQSRTGIYADARIFWDQGVALWDRHTLALPYMGFAPLALPFQGKNYAIYPIGFSVACIPSYVLAKVLGAIPGAPTALVMKAATHGSSTFLLAATTALFFRISRRNGAALKSAVGFSILLGVGTLLTVYSRHAYSELLQTFLLLWMVDACFRLHDQFSTRAAIEIGFTAGALLNTKSVNLVVVGGIGLWLLWYVRQRRAELLKTVLGALPIFLALAALMAYVNLIKRGGLTDAGYAASTHNTPQFTGRPWDSLYGFLFSPGRSIFLHSPPLILGVLAFRDYLARWPARAALLTIAVVGVGVPHIFYHSWYGGPFWGPRYMVPLTPILLLPAVTWLPDALTRGWVRLRKTGFAALATFSIYVQAMGCLLYWDFFRKMVEILGGPRDPTWTYVSNVFIPAFSSLVGHTWLAWHFLTGNRDLSTTVPWSMEVTRPVNFDAHFDMPLDFWFLEWAPAAPILTKVIVAVLLIGIIVSGASIWRGIRADSARASEPRI